MQIEVLNVIGTMSVGQLGPGNTIMGGKGSFARFAALVSQFLKRNIACQVIFNCWCWSNSVAHTRETPNILAWY